MHKYLKALGFDNIQTRSDLKKLLEEVEEQCTHQTIVSYKPGEDFCELKKEYGQSMGIALCGGLDEREYFDPYYYFPYFEGSGISTYAEIAVERKIEKEQYLGMCEDSKIGISLIFTVQMNRIYERTSGRIPGRSDDVSYFIRACFIRNDIASGKQRREKRKVGKRSFG